jgi:hypothetical protein
MELTLSIKVRSIRSMTPFCYGVYDCVNCWFIPISSQKDTNWSFTYFLHDIWINIQFFYCIKPPQELWKNFIFLSYKIDPNFARKIINKGHEIEGSCKWSYRKWIANVKMYKLKNSKVAQIILWWNLSWWCFPS